MHARGTGATRRKFEAQKRRRRERSGEVEVVHGGGEGFLLLLFFEGGCCTREVADAMPPHPRSGERASGGKSRCS
jgi:hypothetical protein